MNYLCTLTTLLVSCSGDALLTPSLPDQATVAPDLSVPGPDLATQDLGPSCHDGIQDGAETDVDCGGPDCEPCNDGEHCLASGDCNSANCIGMICRNAIHCKDGVRDDAETDIDCGGPICPYCGSGASCNGDLDCAAATVCASGRCGNAPNLKLAWKDPVPYDTDSSPFGVMPGDLNGDGKIDIAVLCLNEFPNPTKFDAYLGRGDGTFALPKVTSTSGRGLVYPQLADFNRDGKVDIVTAGPAFSVHFFAGRGDGTFAAETTGHVASITGSWSAGDVDGDGILDLVGGGMRGISISLGNGKGGFTDGPSIPPPAGKGCGYDAGAVDLDRDGRLDVLGVCYGGTDVMFARNKGQAMFGAAQPLALSLLASDVTAYDFDKDGYPDIVGGGVDLLRGQANLNYAKPQSFEVDGARIAVADLDRDGYGDLFVSLSGNRLAILRGAAGPSFRAANFVTTAAMQLGGFAVADFNRDGKPDVAYADNAGNKLYIMLNDSR